MKIPTAGQQHGKGGYKPAGDSTGGGSTDGKPITGGYQGSGETRGGEKSVVRKAPHSK